MPRTKTIRKVKKPKLTRRVRIGIRWLEPFGIERGDTAIIAMTGEVQTGELGYFETYSQDFGEGIPVYSYHQFPFLREQDTNCKSWARPRKNGGICLQEAPIKGLRGCRANHRGKAYGRVIGVERKRRPVDATLNFRPLDEREQASTRIMRTKPKNNISPKLDERKMIDRDPFFGIPIIGTIGGANSDFAFGRVADDGSITLISSDQPQDDEWPDVIGE